jgi:hypothetical protein
MLKIKHCKRAQQKVRRFPQSPKQFCYFFPFHAPFISFFFEIGIAGKAFPAKATRRTEKIYINDFGWKEGIAYDYDAGVS